LREKKERKRQRRADAAIAREAGETVSEDTENDTDTENETDGDEDTESDTDADPDTDAEADGDSE
jgi:hypothetical protein